MCFNQSYGAVIESSSSLDEPSITLFNNDVSASSARYHEDRVPLPMSILGLSPPTVYLGESG